MSNSGIVALVPREVKAAKGGRINIRDNVEEIYEKRIRPYGNGAKIDAQKKTDRKKSLHHHPKRLNLIFVP